MQQKLNPSLSVPFGAVDKFLDAMPGPLLRREPDGVVQFLFPHRVHKVRRAAETYLKELVVRARVVGKATLIAKRDVLEVRVNRSDFGLPPYGPLFLGGPHEVRHRGLVEQDQDTILGAIREFTHAVALEPAHPLIAFWAAGYFVRSSSMLSTIPCWRRSTISGRVFFFSVPRVIPPTRSVRAWSQTSSNRFWSCLSDLADHSSSA